MMQDLADDAVASQLQGLLEDCFYVASGGVGPPDHAEATPFQDMNRGQVEETAHVCLVRSSADFKDSLNLLLVSQR